jgi:hypothetical protein
MKYAICTGADQTLVYLGPNGRFTVKHGEALLFDTRKEAESAAKAADPYDDKVIEEVEDEAEFRARPDTW